MISFNKVSKIYSKDIVALRDINFDIDKGEFMFLVGHSGAGKSTLIRLLIRQELPTKGNILFDQIDVTQITRKMLPIYRQNIGVVFQDYKLIESKTVKENIEFALEITGKSDTEIEETTQSLIDVVRLKKRGHLFPNQLSGGEKQRAGIARALANDPQLLIADEPTGNLDPQTSEEIIEILEKINSWGTTIMIATHDKETVNRLQKRVIRLENGKVVSDLQSSTYHAYSIDQITIDNHSQSETQEEDSKSTDTKPHDAKSKDAKSAKDLQSQSTSTPKNKSTTESESPDKKTKAEADEVKQSQSIHNKQGASKTSKNSSDQKSKKEKSDKKDTSNALPQIESLENESIKKLNLPTGIEKILFKNKLKTIGKLLDLSETDLDNIDGLNTTKRKLIIHELERLLQREE
jgi:cell division transport system ATP-binding protein